MIDKLDFGIFDMYCDGCYEREEFDVDNDFYQMITEAKENGWKIINRNGNWDHYCQECAQKEQFEKTETEK